jgi:DsbC/DsbD-like thiol-disulfide interchange protein
MLRVPGSKSISMALTLIMISVLVGASGRGSEQIPKEPVKWALKANAPEKPLKPGAAFSVRLEATIAQGWHLYAMEQAEGGPLPTRITMPPDQPFGQAGTIGYSVPKSAMDPNFNLMTEYYEERAAFTIPVKAAATAAAGKPELKVSVSFQTCSDEICLPPKIVKLAVAINLAAQR